MTLFIANKFTEGLPSNKYFIDIDGVNLLNASYAVAYFISKSTNLPEENLKINKSAP